MAYTLRTKDNALDLGRAADQNESVDNDIEFNTRTLNLHSQVLGPNPPASTGGMVKQFVKKTGLVDNTATEVFTITTVNEAGDNDGGVYFVWFQGFATHGIGPTGDTGIYGCDVKFARAMKATGAGNSSGVGVPGSYNADVNSDPAQKDIDSVTVTVPETSDYVTSVQFQVNISGATITTADVYGMVTLIYAGFSTAPVITSAG